MEQQERSKMLGTMPMGRLVPKVSVPIMVSMLVQALYNIVDGIFVARYSPNALTAVSLAFPIQLLMIAVATGLGVGINSLISRKLGQKRAEEAREAARCGMLLELCGFVVFLLFGLLGSHSFFHVFTPDPELQQMAGDYLRIVTVFSFGLFLSISFERMMQATGNTMLSMTTQLTGAVINIILDPIMIFGLLGTPQMGVAGAGYATVLSQFISGLLCLLYMIKKFPILHLQKKDWVFRRATCLHLLKVGAPMAFQFSITAIGVITLQGAVNSFGSSVTAGFTAASKVETLTQQLMSTLSTTTATFVGQNRAHPRGRAPLPPDHGHQLPGSDRHRLSVLARLRLTLYLR